MTNTHNTRNQYGTTNPVLIEARINHDPYDEFAWVQEWRFAIAQFLSDLGEYVPDFRGSDDIRESYAYESLENTFTCSAQDIRALTYAFRILSRYREWLSLAGKDY